MFSQVDQIVLRQCAEAMARGEEREVDLFETLGYSGSKEMKWEIRGKLKDLVEEISDGERSVTAGDPDLFEGELVSPAYYFVVHDISDMTITGIIRELKGNMVLYILRPDKHGLLKVEPAT